MNRNVVLIAPGLEPFVASDNSLVLEKELAYEGEFATKGTTFKITPSVLEHWQKTHAEMLSAGVEVPVPVEHTNDPEKKRGFLRSITVRKNKRGRMAAYGTIEFLSPEARDAHLHTQVSVFVPAEYRLGDKSKTFKRPIRHVALTDYPVIPGLEPMRPLALSFTGDLSMADVTLQDLATKLSIDPADMDDQALLAALAEKIDALVQENTDLKAKTDAGGGDKGGKKKPVAASDPMVKLTIKDRNAELDSLVREFRITPAQANELRKQHTNPEHVALALSEEDNAFDDLLSVLKTNTPYSKGRDGVRLSDSRKEKHGALVADAESRGKK